MPNKRLPGTRPRTVAMPDELWAALQARAKAAEVSVGAVIRAACERFVKEEEK